MTSIFKLLITIKNFLSGSITVPRVFLAPIIISLVAAAIFLLQVLLLWRFTVDDAFITFRYSANLASGDGPTFNPGLPPIEGYTSFFWMLVMTIPHLISVEVQFFSKIVGIVATILYVIISTRFVYRLAEFLEEKFRYISAVIVALLLACFGPTAVHAVSGMETALFTFFLISFFYLTFFLNQKTSKSSISLLALDALMLGLTRPEGNIVSVVGLFCAYLMLPKQYKGFFAGATLLLYVLPGGMYFLWRATYYGHLFPLPFYLKVSHDLFSGLYDVIGFVRYITDIVGIMILLGLLIILRSNFLTAFLCSGLFTIFMIFPAHVMDYEWRYLFPLVPFIFVMAGSGIAVLYCWMISERKPICTSQHSHFVIFDRESALSKAIFYAVCVITCLFMLGSVPSIVRQKRNYASSLKEAHIRLGKHLSLLNRLMGRHALLAIGDVGAVPYYSKWRTIDTFGLNNVEIALSGKRKPEYILQAKPDLVILLSRNSTSFQPRLPWELKLYKKCLGEGMAKVDTLRFNSEYYLWLLSNPGSQIYKYVERLQ